MFTNILKFIAEYPWTVLIFLFLVSLILGRMRDIFSLARKRDETEVEHLKRQLADQQKESEKERQSLTISLAKLQAKEERREADLQEFLEMKTAAMPWLAGMISDYLTYELKDLADSLNWGYDKKRLKKVRSLIELRSETRQMIEKARIAEYQLAYLLQLFPDLDDYLDFSGPDLHADLSPVGKGYGEDPAHKFLTETEWRSLTVTQRNQLALDRYVESRKSKWEIGRDYELSVAYEYRLKGFSVDTYGSYKRLEDLGRDLIARKDGKVFIVQCKYWSEKMEKVIREKHVFQLYGTCIHYELEHSNLIPVQVKGVIVTNVTLSDTARAAAKKLGILYAEKHPMVDFPRIKCNVGRDEYGETYIYHLPMDAQYDNTKIENAGECYAFTVAEAESKGFRRAYKWTGG